jgi:hypothetical protein
MAVDISFCGNRFGWPGERRINTAPPAVALAKRVADDVPLAPAGPVTASRRIFFATFAGLKRLAVNGLPLFRRLWLDAVPVAQPLFYRI